MDAMFDPMNRNTRAVVVGLIALAVVFFVAYELHSH